MVEGPGRKGMADRPDNRSGLTLDRQATMRDAVRLRSHARKKGSTRGQLKFPGRLDMVPDSARHLVDAVFYPTATSDNQPAQSGVIFISANADERVDPTLQAQWEAARSIWSEPIHITPQDRLITLREQGYTTDTNLTLADADSLHQVWKSFGWTLEGVEQFINTYDSGDPTKAGWFACMRDQSGRLVSAAKAEALAIGDIQLIESTEWGTNEEMRGQGLGTGAVIALNHAILQSPPNTPYVIMAEANLDPASPGHRVARDAGFSLAGADMESQEPNHVLRAHVSINGKLRSFLSVQLSPEARAEHYSS